MQGRLNHHYFVKINKRTSERQNPPDIEIFVDFQLN